MNDDDLERFVDEWMSSKTKTYFEVERFSGPGDLGRDVVGFHESKRHDGRWDNYQCKQLASNLTAPDAMRELAKIFYHSSRGEFSLPSRYTFVAPRGVTRDVRKLITSPATFKHDMKVRWDELCANAIVDKKTTALDDQIRKGIDSFDFSNVVALDGAKIVKDPDIMPVLVAWFGEDPGEAPRGSVPTAFQQEETPFVAQLVHAYSENAGSLFTGAAAVLSHSTYGEHLRLQRVRFFDAAAFKRYYRDNTPVEYVPNFEDDIFHGVVDVHRGQHPDVLAKVDAVMGQAARVQPAGVLGKYGRVSVKQGICHHFANEGRLPWKPKP